MIKQLRNLCTLLLLAVASAAWGGEVTFTPGTDTGETSVTKDGVTVTLTTMNNANYYQIYANQSGTFSISEGSITKIEFTCTASGTAKYGPGNASADVGSYSYSENTGTWTGSASSVTISSTVQIRMSSLTITYTTSGDTPTPTTYTVTYNANGGTGTMTDPNSPYEEDAEVTLLTNTFTAPTDMIWDSWEVKDADDNDITVTGGKFTMPASNVTVKAQWVAAPNAPQYNWVLTDFADLTSSDIFVIVGNNGSTYAMRNDGGTNAPVVSAVTIANNMISGTVADNIKWNVSGNATNGYTFNPNGATTTLYCLDSNNGLRIGTGSGTYSDVFFMDASGYLKATIGSVTRYVGIYNSQDWRCYTSPTTNNIKDQTFAFYKRVDANAPQTPSFTISDNNELDYDATSGSFNFEVNNPVNDGTTTVSENVEWISDATISGNSVTFTTTANEATTSRSGVITLTYTYGNNQTVTKDVTITQAALPASYTTIPALFEAATSTETEVKVTFNNWVVSGVSTNGKNVFVTDNNGNGFVIFSNTDQSSTYAAGDILSGTAVSCNLKLYNGFAELLNVNASDLTITSGGTVTAANIAMADLAGVNTGALVSYENLTCSVDNNKYYLSDGTTTLQIFNSLFAFEALEDGKTYNITGVYQQFNNTKEILPRSADDIVLVEDDREDPELAFIPNTFTVTLGEQITNAPTFDNPNEVEVTFSSTDSEIAYWDADNGLVIGEKTGTATITATFDGDDDYKPGTATLVVTVNESVVASIAELPFEFVGGKADIEDTAGLTQEGLGTDYSSSPKLRFDGTGDYLILHFDGTPGTLSFDIKGNTFSGGTFKVQTSVDGETYTDLKTYTELGATQSEVFSNLDANVRYIKWIYTTKSSGNVALGNIVLAELSNDPIINAEDLTIAADATSGEIPYTITNPVEGTSLNASTEADWISDVTVESNKVTFTATENTEPTDREAVITLTYGSITKDVTVTQAAPSVIYTTIPALFEAATSTETEVKVTFNNWVVSGVSTNGKNVFVTDNNGNGFVIFSNTDQSDTFTAGDILSGTAVSCNLKLYNGFAELLNVNASDLTITSGGTVTAANIAMADLAGVNTGALVSYENLTCSVDNNKYYLTDGTTTLQVYNSLFAFEALEDGKNYNITGVYQQFNNTKEILPRSADDIVLVEDDREDPELAFIPAEFTVTLGEQITNAPTFDNPNEVDVTFDSTDAEVAYWDAENGLVIGGEKAGKATITATFEGDDDYKSGTATLVVTVKEDLNVVVGSGIYQKINSASDLEAGKRYLIVGYKQSETAYYAYNGFDEEDANKKYGLAIGVTVENDKIDNNNEAAATPVVLQKAGDNWFIMDGENFLAYTLPEGTTKNNNLFSVSDATTDGTAWIINYESENGYLITNAYNTDRSLEFNSDRFACYLNSQQDVVLYKELQEESSTPGDVNKDGSVTIADVTALVNLLLDADGSVAASGNYDLDAADVNGIDGITVADVEALVKRVLGKE